MILRKIIKIAATRCHILKLKCTKFDFGWGSAPAPAVGAYRPLAGFKGAFTAKERGQEGRTREDRGRGRKGEGELRDSGRGRRGKRLGIAHPLFLA